MAERILVLYRDQVSTHRPHVVVRNIYDLAVDGDPPAEVLEAELARSHASNLDALAASVTRAMTGVSE
jgi:hypothetical protein